MVAEQLYTEERELKDIVQDILSEMGITKAELAERLSEMGEVRYTRSTISKYLSGKYDSNPEGIESVLWEFVHSVEGDEKNSVTGLRSKTEYFESADFVNTLGICRSCQEDMALGIVVAKSGYGKTHSLKKYAKMPRVAYIECDDTMACRDLVEAIEKEIKNNVVSLPKDSTYKNGFRKQEDSNGNDYINRKAAEALRDLKAL